MAISPFKFNSYAASVRTDQLVGLRSELDNLQRQLSTGLKATTYGDLGTDRRISLDVHGKVSRIDGYLKGIQQADLRLKLQNQTVQGFSTLTQKAKSDLAPASYVLTQTGIPTGQLLVSTATGKTTGQILIEDKLQQAIDSLNIDIEGRYLFSGRTTDTKPVVTYDQILNGDGAGRAGVRQLISERRQADGAGGSGRLITGGAGTNVTLDEEAANPPYGFKIAGATSSTAAIASAYTAGPPANVTLNVTGTPNAGDNVTITLKLPDGTQEEVTLTARNANVAGNAYDSFVIGATPAATAANLQAALAAGVQREAGTTLSAASSIVAAGDFFNGSPSNPPLRVPGPGFSTAVAPPAAGTPANTLIWYNGDDTAASARATTSLRIDQAQTVNIGTQANEQAFRIGLAQFAAVAAETFSATDTTARDRYEALTARVRQNLSYPAGTQAPSEIAIELATAGASIKSASERHGTTKNFLGEAVDKIEKASTEEVAVSITSLQTRLQAAYQTTSILSRLSLTNYLN